MAMVGVRVGQDTGVRRVSSSKRVARDSARMLYVVVDMVGMCGLGVHEVTQRGRFCPACILLAPCALLLEALVSARGPSDRYSGKGTKSSKEHMKDSQPPW